MNGWGAGRVIPALHMPRFLALLIAVAVGAGCGNPPPSNYPTQALYVEDTTLGPDDELDVTVYLRGSSEKVEDISKVYTVSASGTFSFPMIGTVEAASRNPADVEQEIRTRLADGFIVEPNVTVQVKEYKSKKVSIFGEVRKPGTLSWRPSMTISEAISNALGFTGMAKEVAVVVTRRGSDGAVEKFTIPVRRNANNKAPPFYMRPGDSIWVPKRLF
jgi:polysaccharide export outer membrane protein